MRKCQGSPLRALADLLRGWRCAECPEVLWVDENVDWRWKRESPMRCPHGASFEELRAKLPVLVHWKLPKHVRGYLEAAVIMGLVRVEQTERGIRYQYAANELVSTGPLDGASSEQMPSLIAARKARRPVNDVVYTAPAFARWAVDYFQPTGQCLDPCRGAGAFYDALAERSARLGDCAADWCEVDQGRDFFQRREPCDWIITNPPWSSYRAISRHAFQLATDVVFLARLHNVLGTAARHRDYLHHGHALKEVVSVDWKEAGLPSEGFTLALFHWQKGHRGDCRWSYPKFSLPEQI
jgi:hypothetical protein